MEIHIEECYDCFNIIVDGVRYHFDQEDNREALVDVFAQLGFDATYEEVY
jgi:NTP pyrophosphatase (non-canonical NTP hydrolase)